MVLELRTCRLLTLAAAPSLPYEPATIDRAWRGSPAQPQHTCTATNPWLARPPPCTFARYPFPAFSVVLPNNNATLAKAMLQALQQAEYVDEATRLFSAEVTVYNPMLDMWVLFVFMVETPKAGGMIPSRTFQTVRLYTVMESEELVPFILEVRRRDCCSLLPCPWQRRQPSHRIVTCPGAFADYRGRLLRRLHDRRGQPHLQAGQEVGL